MFYRHYPKCCDGKYKVLFIHGNMASSQWWQPTLELLQSEFEMVAVDLLGFGQSHDDDATVSLAKHAQEIRVLMGTLQWESFILVGHSLGGAVAMQFAKDYAELLTGLVLVDSAPLDGMKEIDYPLLEKLIASPDFLLAALRGTMSQAVDEEFFQQLASDCLRARSAVIPNTRSLESIDFTSDALKFQQPVLVVHGQNDRIVPLQESERTAKAYPKGTIIVVPNVGHNPQIENVPLFARALKEFIQSTAVGVKGAVT